jgi:D-3-phosphoglycerate dehydrogenase
VDIDGYDVDFKPEGSLIITQHTDKPGIIGRVGTLLGARGVNIAGMYVGRDPQTRRAVMALSVDERVPDEVISEITQLEGMETARLVEL